MKRILQVIPAILISLSTLYAQEVPEIIPPSPSAQEMKTYIDYPVNYAAGLPEINIPIYTIKSKELSIPISLSYHASGFKPNDKDGNVAQGWSLNPGFMISRTVQGKPDEKTLDNLILDESELQFECNYDVTVPENDPCIYNDDGEVVLCFPYGGTFCHDDRIYDTYGGYLFNASSNGPLANETDTEYDIFYYRTLSKSGKFIYERNTQNEFDPITLPYEPIQIETYYSSDAYGNKEITHIEIIDENGILYRYGRSLLVENDITEKSRSYEEHVQGFPKKEYKTSWLITEIVSADKNDIISFEYDITDFIPQFYHPFYKSITSGIYNDNYMTGLFQSAYTKSRLSKISFHGGEVVFNYSLSIDDPSANERLSNVEVFVKNSSIPIKTVEFEVLPFDAGNAYWYKLSEVRYKGEDEVEVEKSFAFEYYEPNSAQFPEMQEIGPDPYTYTSYAIDYLGFYNGENDNESLLMEWDYDIYSTHPDLKWLNGDANRDPNIDFTKLCVLKKITFPTGGTREFEYEGNKVGIGVDAGGLRVRKISNTTEGISLSRFFSYVNYTGTGFGENIVANHNYFRSSKYIGEPFASFTASYSYSSTPHVNFNLSIPPAAYIYVIESLGQDENYQGKIEHIFDMYTTFQSGDIIKDEFPSNDMLNNQPWAGVYSWPTFDKGYGLNIYYQKSFRYGHAFEKETYVYNSENKIVREIKKTYTNLVKKETKGLLVKQEYNDDIWQHQHYWKRNYTIEQLSQQLSTEISTDYFYKPDGSRSSMNTSDNAYFYNDYNQVSKIETTTSQGKTIETSILYPTDYASGAEPFIDEMVAANIINKPIEKYTRDENNNYKSGTLITYNTGTELGLPAIVHTLDQFSISEASFLPSNYGNNFRNDDKYQPMVIYDKYVNGKPVQITSRNGITTAYLWGYNYSYPIAKVVNVSYDNALVELDNVDLDFLQTWTGDQLRNRLDDIRILPKALVTTYTYKPLVGPTSITDARGITNYYEYDGFGRLKTTINKDLHILQEFEYHYKGE